MTYFKFFLRFACFFVGICANEKLDFKMEENCEAEKTASYFWKFMQYIMAEVQANRYSKLPNKYRSLVRKWKKTNTFYALIRNYYSTYAYWFSAKLLSVLYFYYFLRKFSTYTFIQTGLIIGSLEQRAQRKRYGVQTGNEPVGECFYEETGVSYFFSFWNPYSRDAKRLLSGRFLRSELK